MVWRGVALAVLLGTAGCKCSESEPIDAGVKTTEAVPTESFPSVMPGETELEVTLGLGGAELESLAGAPLLLTSSASAGDTERAVTVTAPPTLVLTTPDGGAITDALEFIPERPTGRLERRPGQALDEMFLRAHWLVPAAVTSRLGTGPYVARARWASTEAAFEFELRAPAAPADLVLATARANCEVGMLQKKPLLMLATVDAGLALAPQDLGLTRCQVYGLRDLGQLDLALAAAETLEDSSDGTQLLFELISQMDGGRP